MTDAEKFDPSKALIRKRSTPKFAEFWRRAESDEQASVDGLPQWMQVGIIVPEDRPVQEEGPMIGPEEGAEWCRLCDRSRTECRRICHVLHGSVGLSAMHMLADEYGCSLYQLHEVDAGDRVVVVFYRFLHPSWKVDVLALPDTPAAIESIRLELDRARETLETGL